MLPEPEPVDPGRPQDLDRGPSGGGDLFGGAEQDLDIALAARGEGGAVPDPVPGAGPGRLDGIPGGEGFAGNGVEGDEDREVVRELEADPVVPEALG